MKKILKSIVTFLMVFTFWGSIYSLQNVEAYSLTKTYENSYLFAVPEGGWSSINVYVNYVERYTKPDSNTNKYYRRECVFAYKCAYATSKPGGRIVYIKHYNNAGNEIHNFTNWNNLTVYMPADYNYVWSRYNGRNKLYSNNTGNYAQIAFQVTCDGAVPPIYSGTTKLKLKTN